MEESKVIVRCPSCGAPEGEECYPSCPRRHNKQDAVNHPVHYNQGKIEVIEFIEDKRLGYNLGNAVKYISRAGKKDWTKHVEDLQKAVWYVRREIELVEAELANREPVRPNDMPKVLNTGES